MNLIDGHVTKVLSKKQFTAPKSWDELEGTVYDIFKVEYWDDGGGGQTTELWFKAELFKDIQQGYVFQH